ncbi:MAG: VWA domain-containing protein [Bacteroidota bacterium]|nr:VWA domain-containing protein [Bacteroidota bacterium]
MKILLAPAAFFTLLPMAFSPTKPVINAHKTSINSKKDPKIQVAILLDVSNSMDGLIDQAKAQLWNMVSVMGRVKCGDGNPKIEIALYEYGRSSNDPKAGYVKQISSFTSDLDKLSQELFKLTTNGGDEYCGHVIHTSLDELRWDSVSSNYKVIFIAGNEDFLQGDISYTRSCAEAKAKGVIVNTIYCGDSMQGIREHWNLGGECGNGSYTYINQDAREENTPTPYDSALFVLNNRLNRTYLTYGYSGTKNYEMQASVDQLNMSAGAPGAAKRVAVKANKQLYNNAGWDMVDAYNADSVGFIKKMDKNTLPDSLKNKSREELQKIITTKNEERAAIQKDILKVNTQRENYIAAEKAKRTVANNTPTLETEVEKIIRNQVKRFKMTVE